MALVGSTEGGEGRSCSSVCTNPQLSAVRENDEEGVRGREGIIIRHKEGDVGRY